LGELSFEAFHGPIVFLDGIQGTAQAFPPPLQGIALLPQSRTQALQAALLGLVSWWGCGYRANNTTAWRGH
jgi:hypothetical protein